MKKIAQLINKAPMRKGLLRVRRLNHQHGVVLLIALIMLVVISLLAVTSMRNTGSTEAVLGNVRATELATQAAEIALRHCEAIAAAYAVVTEPDDADADAAVKKWQDPEIWDSALRVPVEPRVPGVPVVLDLSDVNQAGITATYKRLPECMFEPVTVLLTNQPKIDHTGVSNTGTTPTSTSTFIITARGFGPEVAAADEARSRPQGTEVWLQSHIEF